ncbi:MAG: ankyrin repeat domain-containing protein [Gammaproteobacteria bacterium]
MRSHERYNYFLRGLGEIIPDEFNSGLCNAYAIMAMRAQVLGQEDKYFERLKYLNQASDEQLDAITRLLIDYQYKVQKSQAKKEYSSEVVYEKILNSFTQDEQALIKKGQELYCFIHSLLAAFDPSVHLQLVSDELTYTQAEHINLINLVSKKVKDTLIPPIKPILSFHLNFTQEELTQFMTEQIHENDLVQVGIVEHAMYITKKNGKFILHDNDEIYETESAQDLVKYFIENKYFNSLSRTSPFGFWIYRVDGLNDPYPRPTITKLLDEMLADKKADEMNASLPMAIFGGNLKVVDELLERKANASFVDENYANFSLLQEAITNRSMNIALSLIEHEADVTHINNDGFSALHYAVEQNFIELVKILLIKDTVTDRAALLKIALTFDHQALASELLNAGVTIKPEDGYEFAALAAKIGNEALLNHFIKECKLDLTTPVAAQILNAAVIGGHETMVKSLLEKGLKPPVGDQLAEVIKSALLEKHSSVIELLLGPDSIPTFRDSAGNSLLIYAIETGNEGFVKQLINQYALDVNRPSSNGYSPIALAAKCNHSRILDLLISAGANDQKDPFPALHLTTDRLCTRKLIEDYKADLNRKNQYGQTALISAIGDADTPKVELLLEYKAEIDANALNYALELSRFSIAELLLRKGADADIKLLEGCISTGNVDGIEVLLKHGLKIESLNYTSSQVQEICNEKTDALAALIKYDHTKINPETIAWFSNQIKIMLDATPGDDFTKRGIIQLHETMHEIAGDQYYSVQTRFYRMVKCLESYIKAASEAKASQSSHGLFSSPLPPNTITSATALLKEIDEKFSRQFKPVAPTISSP